MRAAARSSRYTRPHGPGRSTRAARGRGRCGRGSAGGPCRRRAPRCRPERAGLGRVRVQDVRPQLADQAGDAPDRDRVEHGVELAAELGISSTSTPSSSRHERHRLLAAADLARGERRPVAREPRAPGSDRLTWSAGPPMLSRAIMRRTRTGAASPARSAKQRVRGAAQALLERHGRVVAEHLAGGREVGPGVADVAGPSTGPRSASRPGLPRISPIVVGDAVDGGRARRRRR